MPKMTKTQTKRMLNDILNKAGKLSPLRGSLTSGCKPPLTVQDFVAIDKIISRGMNRVK